MPESRGTFSCPICGKDEPHKFHDQQQIEFYDALTWQERIDREELARLVAGSPQAKIMTADMIISAGWRKVSALSNGDR